MLKQMHLVCRIACVALAVSAAIWLCPPAQASNITVIDKSEFFSYASFTLPATTTDWYIGALNGSNEKAGGTAISTSYGDQGYDGTCPTFTYGDGTSPIADTTRASLCYTAGSGGTAVITIGVPTGTGNVILWVGGGPLDSGLTASFSTTLESYPTTFGPSLYQYTFNYSSAVAQNLVLTLANGVNSNAGFFGVSVTTVPEPSSLLLLGCALLGPLACAWRKRR